MGQATMRGETTLTEEQRRLVEEHLPLVHRLATKWRACCRQQVEQSDLIQVGALGLMEAARRYDASRQHSFAAFAQARIQGSIRDALRALDPLSRDQRQNVRRLEDMRREMRIRLGREPSLDELAGRLGWPIDAVRRCKADVAALQGGLAQTLSEPKGLTEEDSPFRDQNPDAFRMVLRGELRDAVKEAVTNLPERQQLVLSLYYGEGMTMRDVGDVLAVTESRVSQLHSAAIRALRAQLDDLEPVAAVA
ncbi:MAG: FliA/WhiG family RNA polymerase sigma factor [Acidobacteriota bacterium]